VEDNGIGIPSKYHSAIFDLFFVAEKSDKNTGIGLYIVKQSVEMLNGFIILESEAGKGTKFTITLPVEVNPG
jgi:signal transduction histidine kinase